MKNKFTKKVDRIIKSKINLFSQKLTQEGIKFNSIILFGSHAKGLAKPYSDIDVGIIFPKLDRDEIDESVRLRLLASEIDSRIEPHIISEKDLKKRNNPFIWEVISTGIKVE